MKSPTKLSALAIGLVALSAVGSASADSRAHNMNISLTVEPECMLQVQDQVATISGTTAEQSTGVLISLLCNRGTAYELEVDNGVNFGLNADYPTYRALSNGTEFVAYQLHKDSSMSQDWGTGVDAITGIGTGENEWIQPSLNFIVDQAPTGVYTDDVMVTVNWADV